MAGQWHAAELAVFVDHFYLGSPLLILLWMLVNATLASFITLTSAREGRQTVLESEYREL